MQMLNPFVCGTFHQEDDELFTSSSSPRKYKRKNNPYSTRGLDKFSALLDDLNEKRQKIYSQMNPHDISFVRFVHSNTDEFVPIIVKVKSKDQKHKSQELKVVKARNLTQNSESTVASGQQIAMIDEKKQQPKLESDKKEAKKKRVSWNINKWDSEKPFFYLPFVVILILVLLTLFGRSAAIMFTCVLWYVIPTLKEYKLGVVNSNEGVKKKEYVRGLSEKKMGVVNSNEVVKKKEYVRGVSEKKMGVVNSNEGVKKKEYVKVLSEKKMGMVNSNEGVKKKEYLRGFSEKKMVVSEGVKKKEYIRRWSEKKIVTDHGLLSSPTSGDSEISKNKIEAKHSHKKSW